MKNINIIFALVGVATMLLMTNTCQIANADAIPYPNSGIVNPVTYSFTATATGNIVAYFAGSSAAFDNVLGLMINGTLSSNGFGLDNHSSAIGASFDLGSVNAGDTLTFVMKNLDQGFADPCVYSDPSMNVAYDDSGVDNHNHIYSTDYTTPIAELGSTPKGTYIGFEDLQFPNSDYNYHDETFVFTNVAVKTSVVPEPATVLGFGIPMLMIGLGKLKSLRN